jgi:tetratricopeptide (TPR) repeat protein
MIAMTASATPEAMLRGALLLDRQGRIPEAIAACERVLGRWPELPDCWYNLAVLQRKSRRFSAALDSRCAPTSAARRDFQHLDVLVSAQRLRPAGQSRSPPRDSTRGVR